MINLAERKERVWNGVFFMAATMSIVSLVLIIFFIFSNGLPVMFKYGLDEFLFGTEWRPSNSVPRFGL